MHASILTLPCTNTLRHSLYDEARANDWGGGVQCDEGVGWCVLLHLCTVYM